MTTSVPAQKRIIRRRKLSKWRSILRRIDRTIEGCRQSGEVRSRLRSSSWVGVPMRRLGQVLLLWMLGITSVFSSSPTVKDKLFHENILVVERAAAFAHACLAYIGTDFGVKVYGLRHDFMFHPLVENPQSVFQDSERRIKTFTSLAETKRDWVPADERRSYCLKEKESQENSLKFARKFIQQLK